MSLDVYLTDPTATYDIDYLYEANITHNLTKMADEAGIYKALWRPEEIKASKAKDIIEIVEKGLEKMKESPIYFKQFNPSNGWGSYEDFIPWIERYLIALKTYPESKIGVSR
jgi:hypothetical protein